MDDANQLTVDSAADMELEPQPPKVQPPALVAAEGAVQEAQEGSEIEQSKGSFNAKGDSAKLLSAFSDTKAPPADPDIPPPVPS